MAEGGRYVYAITRGVPDLTGRTGLRGVPLRSVEHRGLVAVVSEVDLSEFGEEGLRRNLEDLAWLEEVARAHDEVVQAVASLGPTAPLRLATIYLDDDGVVERLGESYDDLQLALDRVEGRREWSVKSYADTTSSTAEAPQEAPATGGAGAAYLQRKRSQTLNRQDAERAALDLAEDLYAALSAGAVASRRLQPQDPRLTGHEGTMTLNGAFLVADDDADRFLAAANAWVAEHPASRVEVNGPWPPYSFATLDEQ